MNLSISGARRKALDLEVLHEKDGKQLQGSCGRRNLGSRALGTLTYTTSFTTIALYIRLVSFAMITCFGLELRKLLRIHMLWTSSQTHASLRTALLQDFSTFRPSFQLRDCCHTHSGCSIELRCETLKGIPSANEGLAPPWSKHSEC
jgi:hypothetical protein